MKTLITSLCSAVFTSICFAQNTNVKSEVTTITTTIKDSEGEKRIVKSEETKEVQPIQLQNEKPNTLNIDTKESPVNVTTKTKVSVNGVTESIDIDHSSYYIKDGVKYQVSLDKSGYLMKTPEGKKLSFLRRTSNNNYIFKSKDKFSVGYFDADGNLVLETYDEKTDSIILEKYSVVKP